MRIQICPKCGSPMNVVFDVHEKGNQNMQVRCPKCHTIEDADSDSISTLFMPDDEIIETRAGLEGVEARVMPV